MFTRQAAVAALFAQFSRCIAQFVAATQYLGYIAFEFNGRRRGFEVLQMRPSTTIEIASGAWAEAFVLAATAPIVLAAAAGAASARLWGITLPAREHRDGAGAPGSWLDDKLRTPHAAFEPDRAPAGSTRASDPADHAAASVDQRAGYAVYRTAGGHAVAQIIRSNGAQALGAVVPPEHRPIPGWPLALFMSPWMDRRH